MNKYIEVTLGKQVDRYKLTDISVDDFIEIFLVKVGYKKFIDITEEEYESKKRFEIEMNVEDRFNVEHYTLVHESRESRNEWNRLVRQMKRVAIFDDED